MKDSTERNKNGGKGGLCKANLDRLTGLISVTCICGGNYEERSFSYFTYSFLADFITDYDYLGYICPSSRDFHVEFTCWPDLP